MDDQTILTQLVITVEQQRDLEGHVAALQVATGASAVLLIERAGLLLAARGDEALGDLAVSSLIAGVFRSLGALTTLLREDPITALQHQGTRATLILLMLPSEDMLGLQVPRDQDLTTLRPALRAATEAITPVLLAARASTLTQPFSVSKDTLTTFLGRL